MIRFRVDGNWKTVPLNQDTYKQLLEKLQKGSFVYNMDEMPTWEYEAGKEIAELPQLSLFDAILIKPVEHFENIYKDNGGHFFKHQPNPNLPVDVLELLKKLQICYSLDAPELDDCCFIYAKKQPEKFSDEQLNLMRMRIRSLYLSNKSIDEIAKEFRFKVNVCQIDEHVFEQVEKIR